MAKSDTMGILENKSVQDKIVRLRGQDVILDFAVAEIYGVETREINQAVRNNPRKFPENYIINLDYQEFADLRSNFLIANSPKSRTLPKAFTEKGLYMLATILKGDKAIEATISIIEAFAKLRELSRTIGELSACPEVSCRPVRTSTGRGPLCREAGTSWLTSSVRICRRTGRRQRLS